MDAVAVWAALHRQGATLLDLRVAQRGLTRRHMIKAESAAYERAKRRANAAA